MTYSIVVKTVNKAKNEGLIEFSVVGRQKIVRLTDKGRKLASLIDEIVKLLPDCEIKYNKAEREVDKAWQRRV